MGGNVTIHIKYSPRNMADGGGPGHHNNDAFSPCEPYVTTNLTSQPSTECCQDIIALDQILGNENLPVEQRVAICVCIQMVQKIEGISDDVDTKLPERCGLNTTSIPRITSTTDCSTL